MGETNHLQDHIDRWQVVVAENVALLRSLAPEDWDKPTDLPGWNVRYIAAHLAHLESDLAGHPQAQIDVPEAPHIKGPMGVFTESGPLARAGWSTDAIIDEFESSAATRHEQLIAMMPLDPAAPGDGLARLAGWNWDTLLGNRVFDLWMHQQDIRNAIDRPGGLTGAGAAYTLEHLARALPFVVGKRVGAPAGTTVVVEVTGEQPATFVVAVGEDGRAKALQDVPARPTTRIAMDFATFTLLLGGRRTPDQVTTTVTGDGELASAVLANLAVAP